MEKCWAAAIGGCSDKLSREHYMSEGLWESRQITVSGFDWLNGEEKTVGLGSLTARILCERHNNGLSRLDKEAIKFFSILDEIRRMQDVRLRTGGRDFCNVIKYRVDGTLFERWAAKFLLGILCVVRGEGQRWQLNGSPLHEPPEEIVRAVYGLKPFDFPMGLYVAVSVGERHDFSDAVGATILSFPGDGVTGATMKFKGLAFVIWLSSISPQEHILETDEGRVLGPNGELLIYRLRQGNFKVKRALSQVLKFEWQ